MSRYEKCSDPVRLAAHYAAHGPRSVEVQEDEPWLPVTGWRNADGVLGGWEDKFRSFLDEGNRYRLVLPDPAPIPDDLPPGSIAVDWFDHEAWGVPPGTEPVDGWELEDVGHWKPWELTSGLIRAVRRKPEPPSPDTEDVQLAHAEGRRLPGSSLMRELNSDGGGGWLFLSAGGSWDPLPVNDDGTVTVLKAEDRTR